MKKLSLLLGALCAPLFCLAQNPEADSSNVSYSTLNTIVVNANFAGKNTPVTHTNISEKSLKSSAANSSLPMVLSLQPSVVATTEGGNGLGYTKISVRGVDASRINVSTNGITLNDAESEEVFWVNMPLIQTFLGGVQLQRGAGTSTGGSASFGGSLNMVTARPSERAWGRAEFSYGSYDTYITTIGAGSGRSAGGFSFDAVYSHSDNGGYIRNAKGKLNSLYAQMGWQKGANDLKLIYILGDQSTGITWEGITREQMEQDRKYNPSGEYYDAAGNVHYYDNETDNYTQHHAQLSYNVKLNEYLTWNTLLNYTHGYGYYENYKAENKFSKYGLAPQVIDGVTYKKSDLIIRQRMHNNFYAGYTGVNYDNGKLNASGIFNISYYGGDHYGNVIWAMYNQNIQDNHRYYFNDARKSDVNLFGKLHYNLLDNLTLYGELQFRHVNYFLRGDDKDFSSLNRDNKYDFINPKVGFNLNLDKANKIYASYSISNREPSRSDIKESIKSGKADELKAERLHDIELGYKLLGSRVNASANLFFMEYDNQLVATGKLSESGYVIKQNVKNSYRRGIELAVAWQPASVVRVEGNVTFSKNMAKNSAFYEDLYDNENDWNLIGQKEIFLKKSNLILSPEVVGMAMVTVNPQPELSISFSGKFVGTQYMDNATSPEAKVPAYNKFTLTASRYFKMQNGSRITVSGTVDNLFNSKYYSYGWLTKYHFADGPKDCRWEGVYPQAEINFIVKVAFEF